MIQYFYNDVSYNDVAHSTINIDSTLTLHLHLINYILNSKYACLKSAADPAPPSIVQ